MSGNLISDPKEHSSKLNSVKKEFCKSFSIDLVRPMEVQITVLKNYLLICGEFKRHIVFLCEHRREIIFDVLEGRYMKRLGTKADFAFSRCLVSKKRRKQTKKRWADDLETLYSSICSYKSWVKKAFNVNQDRTYALS